MYQKILVALENGPADKALLPHVRDLAKQLGSRLLLVHVADGWAARQYENLKLAESEEIREDRVYLEKLAGEMRESGLEVDVRLPMGDPATEILKTAVADHCDLIAMSTHGHRFLGDLIHGSTISEVRHKSGVPVLLVRGTPSKM